ncbi:cobalt-precorrin 5A hydrolase [Brevibacillus ginsengisoli]|uniref:cobalt-precorrin 5A hydrolase n=1 Tax=Brevibacillus ginsengisoli TaxID=363854 RepID=UPI003CF85460
MTSYAVVAITKHGAAIARKLGQALPNADVYIKRQHQQEEAEIGQTANQADELEGDQHGDHAEESIRFFDGSVGMLLPTIFSAYKGLILIFSLGAVVRLIAPHLTDKKHDPAVVVVDEQGQHAISVLSGHLGGANELTLKVAELLQAHPVITTASDLQQTIAVDLLGREFGWRWDSPEHLTAVSATVVNGKQVAIVQESGEKGWWPKDRTLPANLTCYESITEAIQSKPEAALLITHRMLETDEQSLLNKGVLYRPKVIVLGIGCNRGTSCEEIETVITETLAELKFSLASVKAICTIELKKDEVGLLETARKHDWEFVWFTADELNTVTLMQPSDTVKKHTGAYGVSEPAAKLYSGATKLALVKKKSGNVTISVAVIP